MLHRCVTFVVETGTLAIGNLLNVYTEHRYNNQALASRRKPPMSQLPRLQQTLALAFSHVYIRHLLLHCVDVAVQHHSTSTRALASKLPDSTT